MSSTTGTVATKVVIERLRCSDNTVITSLILDSTKKLSVRDFTVNVVASHVASPIPLRDPLAMNIGGYVSSARFEFRVADYDGTLYQTINNILLVGKDVDIDSNYRITLVDDTSGTDQTIMTFTGALKTLSVKVSPGAGATNIISVIVELMEGLCR